jgi:hypothetical protein
MRSAGEEAQPFEDVANAGHTVGGPEDAEDTTKDVDDAGARKKGL